MAEEIKKFADLAKHLQFHFSMLEVTKMVEGKKMLEVHLPGTALIQFMQFLKTDTQCLFRVLMDVCGVDWSASDASRPRFMVVYHLLSPLLNQRIRCKVFLKDGDMVPSITPLFPNANWYEREVYDMFGILFENHPDLRRILTDYEFQGYPLRKDFPLSGFVQVEYDAAARACLYRPVSLERPHVDMRAPELKDE